ncbi:MAG TPA: response regulator [Burkholderiales bacterium]|nr:response regulator [Burkholderiales bacterium]
MRILVVEDDPMVADGLKLGLERAAFAVDAVPSAEKAEAALRGESFDLAIVDLGLPGADGKELVRRLRRRGEPLPLLILTARDTLEDRVTGLELGADDFMVKPFQLPELVARVRALIRRSRSVLSSEIDHGPLKMDLSRRSASLAGQPIELTGREWSILECLLLHAPKVVSKERLLQSISGWDSELTQNAIEVYVSRLRYKLEPGGIRIRTVRGIGYRLDEPGNQAG